MLYAANQFDKLICSKNITENELKCKEKCGHIKVFNLINCALIMIFIFKIVELNKIGAFFKK